MPVENVTPTYFVRESDFETALCQLLPRHGWTEEVIMNPTEDDLIRNWAEILYNNNRVIVLVIIHSRRVRWDRWWLNLRTPPLHTLSTS